MEAETKTTSSELVKLVENSGLEKTKAEQIALMFEPFLKAMHETELKIKAIDKENPGPLDSKLAREIRLALARTIRIPAEKVKTDGKAQILIEGRLYDNAYGIISNTCKLLESECEQIEKFEQIRETNRKNALEAERIETLKEFPDLDTGYYNLKEMPEDIFLALVSGQRMIAKQKEEESARIEAERIENARLEAERLEAQRLENERLKAEAIEAEKREAELKRIADEEKAKADEVLRLEREANEKAQKEIQEKADRERKELEAEAERKRLKEAADRAKEKAEADKKLAEAEKLRLAEKQKADAMAAQIQRENEAKEKAERERIAAEKKAFKAPDKDKLLIVANLFENIGCPELATEEATAIRQSIIELRTKLVNFIRTKANEL